MLKCINVHKRYRQGGETVHALRGVHFSIDEPGFYAVMGASGSGKSTLLHLLAALDVPDEGEVHVAGRRIDALDDRALTRFRRREIGLIFQQFNLLPTLTARENVELPAVLAGENGHRRDGRGSHRSLRSAELLERLGLGHRLNHRPDALSGGEQQRVAIARALYFSPPIIFADEPTGALDSRTSESLWSLLAELARERDMIVLMVTHEPAAAAHCRRLFILGDGAILGTIETDGLDASGVAARYQQFGR